MGTTGSKAARLVLLGVTAAVAGTFAAAAAVSSGTGSARAAEAARRPNVVVVMTDDQTVESLRVMTNVRRLLSDQGTTFTNNFATFSLCCPSTATFLTGQYAHNHGVLGNAPPAGGYNKLDSTNTLPVWLRRAGYHTVHIGKYLNGYDRSDGVPPGWSEWYGSIDPTTYRFWNYTLNENGRFVTYGGRPENYQGDVYTRKAVDAVRRLAPAQEPFFLSIAYLAPHSGGPRTPGDPQGIATPEPAPRHRNAFDSEPMPRPPSLNEADVSDKPVGIRSRPLLTAAQLGAIEENYQQRLESLLAVDEGVAQLVDALRAAGELDETIILFTSDNGFFHGEHRVPSGKVLLYEPSIRVPLIIRGPGIARGRRVAELAGNIDLAPTIADAANARPGRRMDGRSVLPLARSGQARWGRDILIENGPGLARRRARVQAFAAIRTPRYLYAEYGNGDRELYDLARDPHELDSRHADPAYTAARAELARRLARLRRCAAAECRRGPRLSLSVRGAAARRCVARVAVVGADARWLTRVDVTVAGRPVAVDRRSPFARSVRWRPRRGRVALGARAYLADGRVASLARSVRSCS